MKRILVTLMMMVLVVSSFGYETLAVAGPSDWAIDEVESAIVGGLVPTALQIGYQETITRAEYVLLGLELIEDLDRNVPMRYAFPFNDIDGHVYEEEIVVAYNAGLINGYVDGSFKPNNLITREEIATLVANLVRIIDPARNMWVKDSIEYADDALIAAWARSNINYCYDNNLMRGIGKNGRLLDYMDPKGNATKEQAILLLYRLSISEGIYTELTYKPIALVSDIPGASGSSWALNDFAETVGTDIADSIYDFQSKSYAGVTNIDDTSVELLHNDGSVIWYFNGDYLDIQLNLYDLDNLVMVNEFIELNELSYPDEDIATKVMHIIRLLKVDPTYYLVEDVGEDLELFVVADIMKDSENEIELIEYRFKVIYQAWKE